MFSMLVMVALEPQRFEPECVFNPDDDNSESEEMNERREGTFWCTCCREQPELEDVMY